MQFVLSGLDNTDVGNTISILAYVSQIKSKFLLPNELETLCLELYNCFKCMVPTENVTTVLTCLAHVKEQTYFTLQNFKINVNDQWFFKLMLLTSLKHVKELFNKKTATITMQQKRLILHEAMLIFRADKIESMFMLRLIDNIIKKNKISLDANLALQLLLFSQKVTASPLEGYKSYAQNISKMALPLLDLKDINIFTDLNFLPIRGIETLELVPYFKQAASDKEYVSKLVTKIIAMFSNNIENREGGFLYRSVLFDDFIYWTDVVWPQFFEKFQTVDIEGEFFQSLIKYWIPQTVSLYKLELYTFICTIPICNYLKGHILLETRRKGFIEEYNKHMIQLLRRLFAGETSSALALKIVSSYSKKSICPCNVELKLVAKYLFGHTNALDSEELKCMHRFLSQIGVAGSELYNLENRSTEEEKLFVCYKKYVKDLFSFCLRSLKMSNRNIGAQILVLFWKLSHSFDKSPYLLCYKLDKETFGFYNNIFQQKEIYILMEQVVLESGDPELIKLTRLVLPFSQLYSNDNLLRFIDDCIEHNSIKAAESIKTMTSIIIVQNELKENMTLLQNLFDSVYKHFQNFEPSLKGFFKGVLLFEAILEVSKNSNFQKTIDFVGFDLYCLPVIEYVLQNDCIMDIYGQEIKKGNFNTTDQEFNLLCKVQKIMESFLNNVLQYMIQDYSIWHCLDKRKVMTLLVKIIETSNMRRPTTLSADVLKYVARLIDEECQKDDTDAHFEIIRKRDEASSYKIKLLHSTLQKLFDVTPMQNLTIRRNPESRLIIHALCQSNIHPQKPVLTETLRRLLEILSDPRTPDPTVSSAMNCVEILISDNTLYNHTLIFVPEVILQCVEHFNNRNWIVRNSNIQLARSLIDRFFGVLIGHNNRPKSVEDLLCLFPQLTTRFCQVLTSKPLTDSAVIVLQLFTESQIKRQPITNEYISVIRKIFLRLFIVIIKENGDHFGFFAVRAYTSLCFEEEIPDILKDIIEFIIENFTYITENHTIRNFVRLLDELYAKFLGYIGNFPAKSGGYYIIHLHFRRLSMFLKQFNLKQFDLLLLKVLSFDEVMETFKTSNFSIFDYRQRVWHHNYVPFLLINTKAEHFSEVLKEILFKNVSDCIQIKILSIIVDRLSRNNFSNDILEIILNVVVERILVIDDAKKYINLCFFKVIFLLFKYNKTLNISDYCIKEMRSLYGIVKNIHKTFVCILCLAQVHGKVDRDKKFIKTAVQYCHNTDLSNFEMAENMSDMLPFLYMNASCVCDKYRILKIAVFLVKEHGLYSFVSFISNSIISSPLIAMIKILNIEVLVECLDGNEMAYKFVKEFFEFVKNETDTSKYVNKTYYVEEKTVFVDTQFINRICLKFFRDFNKNNENLECFQNN